MASRRGATERVSVVNRQSLGGNWSLRDLIIFPVWVLAPAHIIILLVTHWKTTLLLGTTIYISLHFHSPILLPIIPLVITFIYFFFKFARLYRNHPSIPMSGVLRGLFYQLRLLRRWTHAARNARLGHPSNRPSKEWTPPTILSLQIAGPLGTSIKARIDLGRTGNITSELESRVEKLLAILDARTANVTQIRPGIADLTVHWRSPDLHPGDPWFQSTDAAPIPTIDLDAQGRGALVRLDTSVLIGGETGSGKSNDIWVMLAALNRARIPYKLTVIDPVGGVELDELEHAPNTRVYIDRPQDATPATRKFCDSFQKRLKEMKVRGIRRLTPSQNYPLEILIIDELIVLRDIIAQGAQSPLAEVLATGRKGCYIVWACTQLGQKDVIGHIRDLFPQRVCHRTRTDDLTDAVLGTSATQDGALAHRLTRPGEGYIFTDDLGTFLEFRAPHIVHTRSVAQGGVPIDPPSPTRGSRHHRDDTDPTTTTDGRPGKRGPRTTFVYQLFDSLDALTPAYIGITHNPNTRFKQHQKDKVWFTSVIHQKTIIMAFPNRLAAKEEETRLIQLYRPKYNVQERADWK
jgi:predicted GIY-YIG superfamily endonuclease